MFNIFNRKNKSKSRQKINYNFPLEFLNKYDDKTINQKNKEILKRKKRSLNSLKFLIEINLQLALGHNYYKLIWSEMGYNHFELIYLIDDNDVDSKVEKMRNKINEDIKQNHIPFNINQFYIKSYYNSENNQSFIKVDWSYLIQNDFSIINTRKVFEQGLNSIVEPKFKCLVGINNQGQPMMIDLSQQSNLIVCGDSGSGKSTIVNQILLSLIAKYSHKEIDLKIFDPIKTELNPLESTQYVSEYISEREELYKLLIKVDEEMNKRLELFNSYNVKHINDYNLNQLENNQSPLKRLVIYIDENFILTQELIYLINKISQKGSNVGIHFIMTLMNSLTSNYTTNYMKNVMTRLNDFDWQYIFLIGQYDKDLKDKFDSLNDYLKLYEFIYYQKISPSNESNIIRRGRGCDIDNEILNQVISNLKSQ